MFGPEFFYFLGMFFLGRIIEELIISISSGSLSLVLGFDSDSLLLDFDSVSLVLGSDAVFPFALDVFLRTIMY